MVALVGNTGRPLMPTSPYRARRLLKSGRARIFKHRPFTIMITDREDGAVQEIEYKSDARKAEKSGVWLVPSLEHKVEMQLRLFSQVCSVIPVSSAVFEMGKFDPAYLKAVQSGGLIPKGTDYQLGVRYGAATLRAAIFSRDHQTCLFCGRGIKDEAFLHVHGTHTSRRRSKKTGKVVISIDVEFEQPTMKGRKSAALSKCRIVRKAYNTGWEKLDVPIQKGQRIS